MATAHRIAIVGTPVVALATLAVGLRVGAGSATHAAIVYAAPRARGATAFAWQVVTLVEDHGARETERRAGITVRARTAQGKEATWTGDTNADGVAEATLDLPGAERGDAIDLDVRAEGLAEPLAKGPITWDDAAWMNGAPGPFARPSRRDGTIALDVAVLSGRLAAHAPTTLLVRATSRDDGHAIAGASIAVEPEPGSTSRRASQRRARTGGRRFTASPRCSSRPSRSTRARPTGASRRTGPARSPWRRARWRPPSTASPRRGRAAARHA